MTLPAGADFDAIWRNYVESLRAAAELAADVGLRLTIEGHAHVIVSGTDAMLRLFGQLPHEALAVNFDTSWHFLQREYLPMSILKLGDRIAHVHCRDGDGLLNYGLPPGQGIIDWRGVLRALRDVGFDGFLTLEVSAFAITSRSRPTPEPISSGHSPGSDRRHPQSGRGSRISTGGSGGNVLCGSAWYQ
jgi:sugar phosphate isomerase/epimerase